MGIDYRHEALKDRAAGDSLLGLAVTTDDLTEKAALAARAGQHFAIADVVAAGGCHGVTQPQIGGVWVGTSAPHPAVNAVETPGAEIGLAAGLSGAQRVCLVCRRHGVAAVADRPR